MSLRKNKKEIQRLISAFEREADKFHDIKLSTLIFTDESVSENRKFESFNHSILLWQYYGKLARKGGVDNFINNLKNSDLQYCVKGAQLSLFAVLEGEACHLFVRMAKRAGRLFSPKEVFTISSRVVGEIQKAEADGISKPIAITNQDELAIWLNYLLYYVSQVYPEKEKGGKIDLDPFFLSLLALEQLLEDQEINKVDKSLSKVEDINFKVALSFPGEKRSYVSKVVEFLRKDLGSDQIFYDYDYQAQLARPDLDTMLQKIYRSNSDLIVVFLCKEYSEKQWCGLEWRAIRDIIKAKESEKIMFIRFDNANIEGVFSIDGYIDANQFSEKDISNFILERAILAKT